MIVIAPDIIWEAYKRGYVNERNFSHDINFTAHLFKVVVNTIWASKGVTEARYQKAATRGILDSVEGEEDRCTSIFYDSLPV